MNQYITAVQKKHASPFLINFDFYASFEHNRCRLYCAKVIKGPTEMAKNCLEISLVPFTYCKVAILEIPVMMNTLATAK